MTLFYPLLRLGQDRSRCEATKTCKRRLLKTFDGSQKEFDALSAMKVLARRPLICSTTCLEQAGCTEHGQ